MERFILPAAFTTQTGKYLWEVLCRARTVEFQAFMVACGQCGSYKTVTGEERYMLGIRWSAIPGDRSSRVPGTGLVLSVPGLIATR
jgi:predicted amidohydrolase